MLIGISLFIFLFSFVNGDTPGDFRGWWLINCIIHDLLLNHHLQKHDL